MSLLAARAKFEDPGLSDKLKKEKKDKTDKKEKKDKPDKAKDKDEWDQEVEKLLKAGVWRELKDDKTGKKYYHNPSTKTTTWDLKKDLKKQAASAASPPKPATPPAAPVAAPPAEQPQAIASSPTTPASPPPSTTQTPAVAPTTTGASSFSSIGSTSQPMSSVQSAAGAPFAAPSGPADGSGAPVPGSLGVTDNKDDPVARLLAENAALQRLVATGTHGNVALEVQAKLDSLQRTNQALTVQTERMKHEHDAMARALTEANRKIHEQQLQLSTHNVASERTKDEELSATISHLREQNRVLVTQMAELTTLLARGLGEQAFRSAAQIPAQQQPRRGDIHHTETNIGHNPQQQHVLGTPSLPVYQNVADITNPPSTQYYSEGGTVRAPAGQQTVTPTFAQSSYGIEPSHMASGGGGVGQSSGPGVMFGGFVVKNPRAT